MSQGHRYDKFTSEGNPSTHKTYEPTLKRVNQWHFCDNLCISFRQDDFQRTPLIITEKHRLAWRIWKPCV